MYIVYKNIQTKVLSIKYNLLQLELLLYRNVIIERQLLVIVQMNCIFMLTVSQ